MDSKEIIEKIKKRDNTLVQALNECPELILMGTGNQVLWTKTKDVTLTQGLETGKKLIETLINYRKVAGVGRGLAAPQIGKSESVFITYVSDVTKIYINPKIINFSKDFNCYRELCLSCVYMIVDVKRPCSITIEYTNELGEKKKEDVVGFLARLLQHEYDHLEGILNIDLVEGKDIIDSAFIEPLKEELRNC